MKRLILIAMVVVSVMFFAKVSRADCVDYSGEMEFNCSSGGCQGSYITVTCTFGCVSGTCTNRGGSGECCGRIYYVATIFPDGGDCTNECGGAPVRRSRRSQSSNLKTARTASLEALGPVRLTTDISYVVPRAAVVPDRCRHTYEVLEPTSTDWARGF